MKLNGLDLNKLNVFCSVVRHKGYKGASEELNLTRSAISQAITSFEGTLGQTLFHRMGNKVVPTEKAIRFYTEVLQYQNNLQTTFSDLLSENSQVEGLLKIGVYLEFAKSKLMPVVEEFLTLYPDVQIKFTFDSPSRIEKLLENNLLDLSISIFPHRGIKSIKSQKLYQEELVLIGHRDLIPKQITKEFFNLTPIIDYYPSHVVYKRWWGMHFTQNLSKKINPRVYAATAEMVMELVKRKLGVGVVPRYLLEQATHKAKLEIIQPTEKKLIDFIWLNESILNNRSQLYDVFRKSVAKSFASR
jgi:DNA-binding transcriptional LysR family regulator